MRTLLLAAGLGTRLRPVTDHVPKPAVPFLNVPLLYWAFDFVQSLKPDRLVVNLHYHPEHIRSLGPPIEAAGTPVRFSFEKEKPLGSGGGIWFAREELRGVENFTVANGDEVILPLNDSMLSRMREAHERADALMTLLTMKHPEAGTKFGGVWTEASGRVHGFGFDASKFSSEAKPLHYVGVLMCNKRIFNYLPEGESNVLYDAAVAGIAKGELVQAFRDEMLWFETGNPADFLRASGEVLRLASPISEDTTASLPSKVVQHVLSQWGPEQLRFWESNNGARLLASTLANGSRSYGEICAELEASGGFAVLGPGASIKASVQNAIVMPGQVVASPAQNTIVA